MMTTRAERKKQSTETEHRTFFIYGTMRVDEGRYKELASYVETTTPGVLPKARLYSVGAWPFVVRSELVKEVVYGDIVYIKPELVDIARNMLDGVEGYIEGNKHNLFIRTVVSVYSAAHEAWIDAYIYLAGKELETQIGQEYIKQLKHGDWLRR